MNDYRSNYGASAPPSGRQVATMSAAKPEFALSDVKGVKVGGVALVPTSVGEIMQFATMMSQSKKMVRKHFRGEPEACLALCMQAFRWGMDPFMVANASYEVSDQIAYEAKLLAAVIIQNAPIVGRPVYSYTGEGQSRRCTVEVVTTDGQRLSLETPAKGTIKPQNSPLWISDPDQQLSYYAIRALARRYFPDILLGCYDLEEAESMADVTPKTVEPPQERRTTAALDSLQARRGSTAAKPQPASKPAPAPEPVHEIDAGDYVDDETGEISDDEPNPGDVAAAMDAIDQTFGGDREPDDEDLDVPEMPADALAMFRDKNRWSAGWRWLSTQEDRHLAVLLARHDDLVSVVWNYSDANRKAVEALRRKAGL